MPGQLAHAESVLWGRLRRKRLGARFRRQQVVGDRIVDFYCPDAKIIVELDIGDRPEEAELTEQAARDHALRSQGIHTLRFWIPEITAETDRVVEMIAACIKSAPVPQAWDVVRRDQS